MRKAKLLCRGKHAPGVRGGGKRLDGQEGFGSSDDGTTALADYSAQA